MLPEREVKFRWALLPCPKRPGKGTPHLVPQGRENRVLYSLFPDCSSVSGTQGQSGGPGTDRWDMPLCVCVCVCVCVGREPSSWQCQDALFEGAPWWSSG